MTELLSLDVNLCKAAFNLWLLLGWWLQNRDKHISSFKCHVVAMKNVSFFIIITACDDQDIDGTTSVWCMCMYVCMCYVCICPNLSQP